MLFLGNFVKLLLLPQYPINENLITAKQLPKGYTIHLS